MNKPNKQVATELQITQQQHPHIAYFENIHMLPSSIYSSSSSVVQLQQRESHADAITSNSNDDTTSMEDVFCKYRTLFYLGSAMLVVTIAVVLAMRTRLVGFEWRTNPRAAATIEKVEAASQLGGAVIDRLRR